MTPPPRASKDPNKIKYVECVAGRWVYRPYIPKKLRARFNVDRGGFITPIILGKESEPWHRILAAHAKAVAMIDATADPDKFSLRWIADQYEKSTYYSNLAKASQKKIVTLRRVLEHKITINGMAGTLGDLKPDELTKPNVNTIRDKRLQQYQEDGKSGLSHCNREITYLSSITKWASNHFDEIQTNPFLITKLKENVRERYVNDDEYFAQLEVAATVADYLPVVFELTYLLASRKCESLAIKMEHITTDTDGLPAIFVERTKGSDSNYIRINPRLQQAIDDAMALRKKRKIVGRYLIVGLRKENLNRHTLEGAMKRLRKRMDELNMQSHHSYRNRPRESEYRPMFWTIHDLKRKAVSDADNKRIAGHKSEAMRERYNTKLSSFDAPE